MAMSTVTPSAPLPRFLTLNPSSKTTARFASLSSSTSLFFSYNVSNRPSRLAISADRPGRTNNNNRGFSCNCIFGLGVPELVVIVGVAALVFGPKKLPEVGRSIGKTVKSFQQAAKEFESELKKDGESSAEASSSEKITTVSEEEKQKEAKVPSMKETSQF